VSWYAKAYRKIHWDFDNPAYVSNIGGSFDADQFLANLQKGHVSGVQLVAKDIFGHAYYDTEVGIRHPKLRFDLVETIGDACQRGDIRLVLYYTVIVDDFAARSHPTWRLNDGEKDAVWDACRCGLLCINSPYVEQWVIPQLRELAEGYALDGFFLDHVWAWRMPVCQCKHCQKQFSEDVGGSIPRGPRDARWPEYQRWLHSRVVAFLERCAQVVHDVKPDAVMGANHVCSAESPLAVPASLGFLFEESPDPLSGSFHARYLATAGKPFDVLSTRFAGSWGDWSLLPATALKHEIAPIMANGGQCFLGDKMYPDGRLEDAAYEAIGEAYRFVEEREPFLRGATPVPYIGVLNALLPQFLAESRGLVPLRGAHKALVESGYHCNIMNEQTLLETIGDYKTLLLPDQSCLNREVQQAIREFVSDGGGLVASYATSARDEAGQLLPEFGLADLFGVALEGEYPHSVPLSEETPVGTNYAYAVVTDEGLSPGLGTMPLVVHGRFLNVVPTTARSLAALVHHLNPEEAEDLFAFGDAPAGEDSGYPALVVNAYGKGKGVYVAGELFSAYWNSNAPRLKRLIRNLVELVTPDKLLQIDAPPCVEVALFKQGPRLIVHLINFHGEKVGGGGIFAEYVPPIRDIGIRLLLADSPSKVTQMPEGRSLPYTFEDGLLRVQAPELEIHSCLVVDL
jgi:hypothetical protein